jgi:hypothetical protein
MEKLEVFAHLGNGGLHFKITDEKGPTIEITAGHFGNQTNHVKLHVTKAVINQLAEMLVRASQMDYSEEYVCAADVINQNTGNQQGELKGQMY